MEYVEIAFIGLLFGSIYIAVTIMSVLHTIFRYFLLASLILGIGIIRKKLKLGIVGFLLCAIASYLITPFLGLPLAGLFGVLILRDDTKNDKLNSGDKE